MKKEMLINVLQPEECRIAIIEDGILEELYVERTSLESFTGNIYKGRIVNLEPAIQAAFVDFSVGRNGFLHVSDVEPQYYNRHAPKPSADDDEDDAPAPPRRDRDRKSPGRGPSAPAASDELAPPPSYPEERGRERDRDRDRERGRERPDRSEKGRRDRSSRGFGEGLEDIRFTPAPRAVEPTPPPPPPPPVPPPFTRSLDAERERPREDTRRRPEPATPPRSEEPTTGFGRGLSIDEPAREREPIAEPPSRPRRPETPSYDPEPSRSRRPEPVGFEPDEPRARRPEPPTFEPEPPRSRRPEPTSFEPELPRSRRPEPTGFEPEAPRSRRPDPVSFEPEVPRARRPEPTSFEPETPRSRRPEPAGFEPEPPRARRPEPVDFEPELPRSRRPEPSSIEPDAPRSRRPEPFDPDLPPSRTQRQRPTTPARPPLESDEVEIRSRAVPPQTPIAREPEAEPLIPAPRERLRDKDRDARRGRRGRGGRPFSDGADADVAEPSYPEERDIDAHLDSPIDPLVREAGEMLREPFGDEPPPTRRRGGRDAIRSRGTDRERTERDIPRIPATPPERVRPVSPERSPEIEPERSRPAAERPRAVEPERPRERERDRERAPERRRPSETERPAAQAPRERERGDRDRDRGEREGARPVDRAGEEGYVPRRMRSRPTDSAFDEQPPTWADLDDDVIEPIDAPETALTEEIETEETGEDRGGRRRRRRRSRSRPRGERETTRPAAGDADADLDADADFDAPRPSRTRGPVDDFEFDDHDADDDFSDDDEVVHDADRVVSAEEDRIDPELEEEIRKEIEEIAELEREMGLRGTTEARPRRGDPAGDEEGGRGGKFVRGRGAIKPPIQEIFRRGDEVLIQVIKESIGTKGPTLSTYISIPGRYLVLMPGLNRVGVSRKIADESQRRKLREIMNELNPPKGLGFIVRTAGLDRTKRELARDLAYLLRLWKVILRRIKKAKGPTPIYQESDMITRTIRDIFNAEIDTIWIDEQAAFERAQEFLRVVMPRFVNRLKFYDEKVPLFHKYGIEDEIAKIQRRTVPLPEGGSIVIDQTEALVAIDVNSGNFRVENDAERTAYEMNLRAAKEIARQLRLRDLGGVIVNDFIDMREERNRRGVEKALRDAIKRDRARTKILRMSQFGLIEMTRQRIRPSLKRSIYQDCTHCNGQGVVKTVESMSIDVMRLLALASHRGEVKRVSVSVAAAVAAHMNNRKRQEIARIEAANGLLIHIQPEDDAPVEHLQLDCFDANNNEIRVLPQPPAPGHRRGHHHH